MSYMSSANGVNVTYFLVSKLYAVIFRFATRRHRHVWTAWVGKLVRRLDWVRAMGWEATRQVTYSIHE